MINQKKVRAAIAAGLALAGMTLTHAHADTTLLNVSYDPTRELYVAYNNAFADYWRAPAPKPS